MQDNYQSITAGTSPSRFYNQYTREHEVRRIVLIFDHCLSHRVTSDFWSLVAPVPRPIPLLVCGSVVHRTHPTVETSWPGSSTFRSSRLGRYLREDPCIVREYLTCGMAGISSNLTKNPYFSIHHSDREMARDCTSSNMTRWYDFLDLWSLLFQIHRHPSVAWPRHRSSHSSTGLVISKLLIYRLFFFKYRFLARFSIVLIIMMNNVCSFSTGITLSQSRASFHSCSVVRNSEA